LQNAALKSEIIFKTIQKHHEKRHVLESPNPLSFSPFGVGVFFLFSLELHFLKNVLKKSVQKRNIDQNSTDLDSPGHDVFRGVFG
jgi:hypothetical protein